MSNTIHSVSLHQTQRRELKIRPIPEYLPRNLEVFDILKEHCDECSITSQRKYFQRDIREEKKGTFQRISKNMLLSCSEVENSSLQIICFGLWNIIRISLQGQRIFCMQLCNVISILLLIHHSYFLFTFISQLLLLWIRHVLCFRHSVIKSTGSLKFLLTLLS